MNIQKLISQAGKHLRNEFENIKNSNPHSAERGAKAEIILQDFLNFPLESIQHSDTGFFQGHIILNYKPHTVNRYANQGDANRSAIPAFVQ